MSVNEFFCDTTIIIFDTKIISPSTTLPLRPPKLNEFFGFSDPFEVSSEDLPKEKFIAATGVPSFLGGSTFLAELPKLKLRLPDFSEPSFLLALPKEKAGGLLSFFSDSVAPP